MYPLQRARAVRDTLVDMEAVSPWELCHAAGEGNLADVKRALGAGVDPAKRSMIGSLPLARAAASGSLDVLRLLLAHGAPVNAVEERHLQSHGGPALIAASQAGHEAIVNALLDAGADTSLRTDYGETALSRAAEQGHVEVINALLQGGAKIDDPAGFDEKTALMVAAEWRQEAALICLLEHGADPSLFSSDGRTALHYGAGMGYGQEGAVSIVRHLLKAGCPIDLRREGGETALFGAARFETPQVLLLLLDNGADPTKKTRTGLDPLLAACRYSRYVGIVRLLVEAGAALDGVDEEGYGALARICSTGPSPADGMAALLEAGASVETAQSPRASLFHEALAALSGEETEVLAKLRLLIEAGADPLPRDRTSSTPLHHAARRSEPSSLAILLEVPRLRELINERDEWGRTALHWACRDGHEPATNALIEAGAAISLPDRDGHTALHLAFREDRLEVVKLLLSEGASLTKENDHGKTALYYAQGSCLEWLKSKHPELMVAHDEGARTDHSANCPALAKENSAQTCIVCGWSRAAMDVDRSLHCPRCAFNAVAISNYEVLHGNPLAPTADTEVWFTYTCAHCGAVYGNGWNALNSSHPSMSEANGSASWSSEDGGRSWTRSWGMNE